MHSIVMFFEAINPLETSNPKIVIPITQRLSPQLIAYMKKDPNFASEVNANIKNYETIAKLKMRNVLKK